MMANFSIVAVRWAFAYLLIINSIDTITNNTLINSNTSGNAWIDSLIMLAAAINVVGGVLLASGWKLKTTAMILALSTGVFALVYQAPIAIVISVCLLILSYSKGQTAIISENSTTSRNGNHSSISNDRVVIPDSKTCRC